MITRGDDEVETPYILDVRVAYDRRRGSPPSNYSLADFKLGHGNVKVETSPDESEVLEMSGNRLTIRIDDLDFETAVLGFDERRDLYVDIRPKELNDA